MTRIAALLSLAFLLAACGEGFDPVYRLTKTRVLGLQSEPVAPAVDETTVLTPLIYDPSGDAIDYAWSWCPLAGASTDGYPCLVDEADVAVLGDDVPSFDLGDGPTASFTNSFDPSLLAAACDVAAGSGGLLDCQGGFPIQVRVVVTTGDGQRIDVVRELRLRFREEDEPNANPVIDGLFADEDPIDDGAGVTLRRREERDVRADVAAAVSEAYVGVDDDGAPVDTHELIVLSWFIETGVLRYDRTSYVPDVSDDFALALENRWEPDDELDFDGDTAELIVVVRDDRNGVAIRTGRVTLGDAP